MGISSARNLHADNLQPAARLLLRFQPGLLVLSLSPLRWSLLSHFLSHLLSTLPIRCYGCCSSRQQPAKLPRRPLCVSHACPPCALVCTSGRWGGGSKPTSSEEDLRLSPAPPHIPQMTQASDSGADVSPTASGSPRPNRLHNTTQLNTASSDLWSSTSLCTFSSPLLRHPRRVRSILLHLCSPRANSTNPTAQRGHGRCRSSFGASGPVVLWRKSTTKPSEPAWSLPLVSLVPIAVAYSLSPPTSPRTQGDTCSMQDPHAFAFAIAIETPTITAATTTIHRGCRR